MFRRVLPVVCLLVLVTVSEATAQGRRGPGGQAGPGGPGGGPGGPGGFTRSPMMLLGQESVQKELQMTTQQVQALTTIFEQQRTAMTQAFQLDREERGTRMQEIGKQAETQVAQVLNPQQQQRLTQISLQQQGTRVLDRPEVAQELGLTPEQLKQIQEIQAANTEEMNELFRKQMEQLRKAAEKKVTAVLTPQQLEKWNTARGEPFEGEIVMPRFGGPPRGTSPGEQAARDSNRPSTESSKSSSSESPSSPNGRPAANSKTTPKKPAAKTPATPKKTTSTTKKSGTKAPDNP
jgi:hypothetical protein